MNLQEHLSALSAFPAMPVPYSSSPCSWMPLEGVAQQWADFAGTFLTYPGFAATSAVFSAFSLEAGALQQYDQACHSRFNGDVLRARAACEQAVHDLQDASSQWVSTLYWLERLTSDKRHPLDKEEYASLHTFFSQATEHLHRVGVLTQQVQEACVLCYQQHGILGHEGDQP